MQERAGFKHLKSLVETVRCSAETCYSVYTNTFNNHQQQIVDLQNLLMISEPGIICSSEMIKN